MVTVVIVGASVGGVRTAQALRAEGFTGRIVVLGRETDLPYDKPPLSKQFLSGAWDEVKVALLTAQAAETLDVELRLGVVADQLDVAGNAVVLADGRRVDYDVVVLATGADARPCPWRVDSGVHVVRTLLDSQRLKADLAADGPMVVVGGGFIGAEVASTARAAGHDVTVVDPLPSPIGRLVGPEVGEAFTELHHRHGVATRFGTGVESVEGVAGDLRVILTDGEVLPATVVVVGIGAVPNDDWVASSGLLVDDGVVCDEHGRAAGAENVYAVGDVARWFHPGHGEHMRVEHWTNAVEQGAAVAHTIAHPGDPRAHRPTEYVWSDQHDWKVQIVGRPGLANEHRTVGSLSGETPRAAALYTDESGVLRGAVTVNWPKALVACRRLVAAGADVEDACAQVTALTVRLAS